MLHPGTRISATQEMEDAVPPRGTLDPCTAPSTNGMVGRLPVYSSIFFQNRGLHEITEAAWHQRQSLLRGPAARLVEPSAAGLHRPPGRRPRMCPQPHFAARTAFQSCSTSVITKLSRSRMMSPHCQVLPPHFQPCLQLLTHHQGQERAEHVAHDRRVAPVIDRTSPQQ